MATEIVTMESEAPMAYAFSNQRPGKLLAVHVESAAPVELELRVGGQLVPTKKPTKDDPRHRVDALPLLFGQGVRVRIVKADAPVEAVQLELTP